MRSFLLLFPGVLDFYTQVGHYEVVQLAFKLQF